MIERTGVVEKFLNLICHYNSPNVISELPFILNLFCLLLKVINRIYYIFIYIIILTYLNRKVTM